MAYDKATLLSLIEDQETTALEMLEYVDAFWPAESFETGWPEQQARERVALKWVWTKVVVANFGKGRKVGDSQFKRLQLANAQVTEHLLALLES